MGIATSGFKWAVLAGCCLTAGAQAASATFVASVIGVDTDSGTSMFSGVGVGTVFEGLFDYGNSASLNVLEANEASYRPAGVNLAQLGWHSASTSGSEVAVVIQNDWPLDDDSVAFASLLGLTLTPGTPVDSWTIAGLSAGAYEADPDPSDGDDTQLVYDGARFEFALVSLDTAQFANLDYRPLPPALGGPGGFIGAFTVEQADAQGQTLFLAYGSITQVSAIPEPAGAWLLGAGLAGVLAATARRRASTRQR